MRPLRIEIEAFGAFAQRQVIDLEPLGTSALFLVHGPTGAGKTTILDAITFALFGESSGDERSGKQLRSQHAGPERATEVVLEFALGQERYRVLRRPEMERRPNRKGDGWIKEEAAATLWCRTDAGDAGAEGVVMATRPTEVRAQIVRLLGFDADRFRQVMLLPQGRFRELLSAKSTEREAVLAQLFGTERYARLQAFMKRRQEQAAAACKETSAQRENLLLQVGAGGGAELAAMLAERSVGFDTMTAALPGLVATDAAALAALAAGREAAAKLLAAADARTACEALAASLPELAAAKARHDAAKRAAGLAAELALVDDADRAAAQAMDDLRTAQAHLGRARDEQEEAVRRLQREQAREPERVAASAAADRLALLASRLDEVREAHDAAAAAAVEEVRVAGALTQAQAAQGAGRIEAARAMAALERVEAAWSEGSAARLAASLVPGEPCPVCGSAEHPAPAQRSAETPHDRDVEDARAAVEAATQAQAALDGRAEAAAGCAHEAALARATTEGRLRGLPELPEAWLRMGTPAQARAAAARDCRSAATARDQLLEALDREEKGQAQAANGVLGAQVALTAATTTADAGARRLASARADLGQRARDAGFPDESAAHAARMAETDLASLERRIVDDEAKRTSAADRLHRAVADAAGIRPPDLPTLEADAAAAQRALAEANRALGRAQAEREQLAKASEGLNRLETRLAGLEVHLARIGRLTEVANGKAAGGVTFQRYVLGTLLDEVLEAASVRLRRMSRGRFDLRRALCDRVGNRSAGLDLEVDDAFTGQSRPASTLSGGEGFQAALALALGLADVVQMRAGGIRLDTVFIDEGFGSLDPEALQEAISVLLDLGASHRLVGIVSHVQELQESIPLRLAVTRSERGSSARLEGA